MPLCGFASASSILADVTDALHMQFLAYSADKLRQLTGRIEKCLGELNEEQVWTRGTDNENAVGNLVLHLCGNVRQWIISGVGGKPDVRHRDAEFAARGGLSVTELAARLRVTVEEAAQVISQVPLQQMAEPLEIQEYNVNVMEAIYHVVEHFSHHTGQIIFATKLMLGMDLGFYSHLTKKTPHSEQTP
jgi:uncharacterized damage-inducible protein DinB